jgi:ribosomal protein S24E
MSVTISAKKEQPLLSRTEVTGSCSFKGKVCSKDEVKKEVALQLKADEKLLSVHRIDPVYGAEEADFIVYIYSNEKDMVAIEPKKKEKKQVKKE